MTIKWLKTDIVLPNGGDRVLVIHGSDIKTATFECGLSQGDRERMISGKLPDEKEIGWNGADGFRSINRSSIYKRADQHGNNLVPYCWVLDVGTIFGQNIQWWAKFPDLKDFT